MNAHAVAVPWPEPRRARRPKRPPRKLLEALARVAFDMVVILLAGCVRDGSSLAVAGVCAGWFLCRLLMTDLPELSEQIDKWKDEG